jgi:hypothetical protein
LNDPLRRLSSRVEFDPSFLGHKSAEYAMAQGGLSDVGLATRLGCPADTLVNLRLCRMPRNQEDVKLIADRFGIDPARLTEVLGGPDEPT